MWKSERKLVALLTAGGHDVGMPTGALGGGELHYLLVIKALSRQLSGKWKSLDSTTIAQCYIRDILKLYASINNTFLIRPTRLDRPTHGLIVLEPLRILGESRRSPEHRPIAICKFPRPA